jgi:hypothetical protein
MVGDQLWRWLWPPANGATILPIGSINLMSEETSKKTDKTATDRIDRLGTITIIGGLVLGAMVFITCIVWKCFFLPTLVLSAYWSDPSSTPHSGNINISEKPKLIVTGEVLVRGKPVQDGTVKLTLEPLNEHASATIVMQLVNGAFKMPDLDLELHPMQPIRVRAEGWSSGFIGSATDEVSTGLSPELSLRVAYSILIGILGLQVISFVWTFTGPQSKQKNRIAIILSYIVICIFLAVPLAAPILLTQLFPSVLD